MVNLMAAHIPDEAHLFSWYMGFAITFALIVIVVIEVQAILMLARKIGTQAQAIIASLEDSFVNTSPLHDLARTVDFATNILGGLTATRKGLGG